MLFRTPLHQVMEKEKMLLRNSKTLQPMALFTVFGMLATVPKEKCNSMESLTLANMRLRWLRSGTNSHLSSQMLVMVKTPRAWLQVRLVQFFMEHLHLQTHILASFIMFGNCSCRTTHKGPNFNEQWKTT